jgi:hypothetical protein
LPIFQTRNSRFDACQRNIEFVHVYLSILRESCTTHQLALIKLKS